MGYLSWRGGLSILTICTQTVVQSVNSSRVYPRRRDINHFGTGVSRCETSATLALVYQVNRHQSSWYRCIKEMRHLLSRHGFIRRAREQNQGWSLPKKHAIPVAFEISFSLYSSLIYLRAVSSLSNCTHT